MENTNPDINKYIDDTEEIYEHKQMELRRDGNHRYLWKSGAVLLDFMVRIPEEFQKEVNRRQLLNEWVTLHAFVLNLERNPGDQYPTSS